MLRSFVTQLVFLLIFFGEYDAARILAVFPTPSISHQVVFRPLTQELARRGHEVTVITTDPVFKKDNAPANLTEIDLHDISYNYWRENIIKDETILGNKESLYTQVEVIGTLLWEIPEIQMSTREVQDILHKGANAYDLLILEECAKPYLILSHVFKAPVIAVSSLGLMLGSNQIIGTSDQIFLYPTIFNQKLYNLTFWEKLHELYKNFRLKKIWLSKLVDNLKTFENILGQELPPYSELNKNIDMMFLNMHPMWSHNQPLPPNVISIWGIHKNPEQSLPKDLQSYLDSSKNGVIYFSLGTNVPSSLLPPKIIQILINVFSKLPYDVLWKWDSGELPGKTKNIRISKWLPQSDLLRHPNIKLFITQGGLQSTDEAIYASVPLVGIPLLADQWYNVELYTYHKIGVGLDFETLSENALNEAIKIVIEDKSYRENIVRLRSIMRDEPESALERAVWWTEYVLRHRGAKHLRAQGANKTWVEYYEIEFISILVTIIIFIVTISLYTLRLLLRSTMPKSKSKVS